MYDERNYSGISDDSEEIEHRMDMDNELAAASTEEAEEFIENYAKEVNAKVVAGDLSKSDLDILLARIRDIRETRGH